MTTFFFLLTILFIFVELASAEDGAKISLDLRKAKLLRGEEGGKQKYRDAVKEHSAFLTLGAIYLLWLFIGLMMSSQWLWFAVILAQSFLGGFITKKMSDEWYVKYKYVDVTISVLILFWVAFHHFHH